MTTTSDQPLPGRATSGIVGGSATYPGILARLGAVLAVLAVIGWSVIRSITPEDEAAPVAIAPEPTEMVAVSEEASLPPPEPESADGAEPVEPVESPTPAVDHAAVAEAESALASSTRVRARSEAVAAQTAQAVTTAVLRAANDALTARTLAHRLRDPSARIERASARGGVLRDEQRKLKDELATIARAPRPEQALLIHKTPVARPAEGEEFHFELRRNRVTFIDLQRLLEHVKADAKIRMRLSHGPRVISGSVQPVGAFALDYELVRVLPESLESLFEGRNVMYDLAAWELVPKSEMRGETLAMVHHPASEFARAVNRLNPSRSTVTMWVYPDSFGLYRQLRDLLHARGFLVAARPLPEGMGIRGSPLGSLSAGQ